MREWQLSIGSVCLGALVFAVSFALLGPIGALLARAGLALIGVGFGLALDWAIRPNDPPNMVAIAVFAFAFTSTFPG